ncbi:hypothetical protein [Streptomyces sp. KL110A]
MKPRVTGVLINGRWHYGFHADWAFLVTIAVAHGWLKRGAR